MMTEFEKQQLIEFMNCSGFDYITNIGYINGQEMVASLRDDGLEWWRPLELEGSGFTKLFKGSIKTVFGEH